MYCEGCKKEHNDKSWRYKDGWYCTKYIKPLPMGEFIPDDVKDGRSEYFNSIVQPYRGEELSQEYLDVYGKDTLGISEEEASKAKNTWRDVEGWDTREKSK